MLSLTLAGGSVEVRGTVKRAGKAVAGAMVVLVPKDQEVNRDLIRRDQTDLDGSFSLRNVVTGSYTVMAIEKGWDLDWSRPNVLAASLKGGQTIEVGNQKGRINLPSKCNPSRCSVPWTVGGLPAQIAAVRICHGEDAEAMEFASQRASKGKNHLPRRWNR